MRGDLLEIFAREKAGMPPEWQVFRWAALPFDEHPALYYELTGAIPGLTREGKKSWRNRDRSTEKKVTITAESALRLGEEWSKRTGLCIKCAGESQLLKRWSIKTGSEYQPCPKCNATGKAI